MPGLIERFVQERRYLKNVSAKTVAWYGHAFHAFAGCGLEDPTKIPPAQLKANLQQKVIELRTRGVRATSVTSWLRVVNAFLTWLRLEEHVGYHLRLPKLQEPQLVIPSVSAQDIQKCSRSGFTWMRRERHCEIATAETTKQQRISRHTEEMRYRIFADSLGLEPWPERTPLNARVVGTVDRGDFKIEKVVFESQPGFLVGSRTGAVFRRFSLSVGSPFPLGVPH